MTEQSEYEKSQSIIRDNLKKFRERNKLSLRRFADAVGYSHTHISDVEKGITDATHSYLKRVSKAFRIPIAFWSAANGDQEDLIQYIEDSLSGRGDLDRALDKADVLISESKGSLQLINSLNLKGRVYLQLGQRKLALECWQKAKTFLLDVNDSDMTFSVLFNIALCHYHLHEYDKALDMLEIVVENCPEMSRPLALQLKANIYANQNDFESSLSLHSSVLEIYRAHNLHEHIIESLHNLADIDMKLGNPLEAINRYEEALSIAYEVNHYDMICRTANDLSSGYLMQGNSDIAKDLLEKAIKIVGNRAPVPLLAALFLKLATAEEDHKRRAKFLKTAFDVVKMSDDHSLIHDISLELASIYHDEGDVESALRYYKIASISYKRFSGVMK
ncbi:tetratricopeptide repeat protein [Tumebacillus flagellatus]|uniref:HTH cro/C1-type domain-containing protein n=1 Tax=Tumebacillus flagellatus TaxID=1157490 RepID=A0A074LJ62_9BACL|nr:tetratricopeptide repeat protein [Tumebacillus flagellatus]KEO81129.1 hypothetical protein EL26_22340 [Tumebacillus flagellatus]